MAVATIYFDEAGFTGYDLLNPVQPVFCVASSMIGEAEAKAVLERAFPRYQGKEYKFSAIWGRPTNRRGLETLADEMMKLGGRTFIYHIDKKFAVLTKAVDILVEPLLRSTGVDFYHRGFGRRYLNMCYFALTTFAPPELLDAVVQSYDAFSRDPDEAKLQAMARRYAMMSTSAGPEIEPFMVMLAEGAGAYHRFHDMKHQRESNDLHITSVLSCVMFWRGRVADDLAVVHDASSHFFRQIERWEQVTSPDVPAGVIDLGDGRKTEFPLRVVSTTSGDSAASHALQLCDLLAGTCARLLRGDNSEEEQGFLRDLVPRGLGEINSDGIRPGADFIEGEPRQGGGPDAVDQLTALIGKWK